MTDYLRRVGRGVFTGVPDDLHWLAQVFVRRAELGRAYWDRRWHGCQRRACMDALVACANKPYPTQLATQRYETAVDYNPPSLGSVHCPREPRQTD